MKSYTRRMLLRGGLGAGAAGAIGVVAGGISGVVGTFVDVRTAGAALVRTTRTTNTCPCTLEYSWDDTVPADLRIHTLTRIINRGPEHIGILDESIFAVVTEEAQRWSKAMLALDTLFPDTPRSWVYTAGRLLQITTPALSAARRRTVQDAIDLEVGLNKVEIL